MAEFSASDAAFTGFRVVREHPLAAAVWAAAQFGISVALGAFVTLTCGAAMTRLIAMQTDSGFASDPAKVLGLARQMGPLFAALAVFLLVFYPVLFAAMNRAVLRPNESKLGYLRLGRDELRQLLLMLLFGLLFLAAYLALVVAAALASVVVGLAVSAGDAQVGGVATALVMAVAFVGGGCALVFFGVRLSLASALTFANRRVDLFGSWRLTHGRFWPILGTYMLALALAALVWSLVFALTTAAAAVIGGSVDAFEALMRADLTSPAAYFSPTRLVYLALSAVSSALVWPLALTPAASIYLHLAGSGGRSAGANPVTDVFA